MFHSNPSKPRNAQDWQAQVAHLEQRIAALESLQEVARTFTSELELTRLLELIVLSAVDVLKAGAGSLLLYDSATNELVFQVVQGGSGKALRHTRIKSDEGIAGWVYTHRKALIVLDTKSDPRWLDRMDESFKFHTVAMVAAPLIYKGKPTGVIEILNKKSGEQFNEDDRDLLMAFAAQSAVVIENARLYQQVVAERDRILAVEDEVRHELARDLHDGPSQLLAAIIMGLKFLKEVIVRQPERAGTEVEELEHLSTQALHQVRNLLFDLRPVVLETQGLCAALQVYVERQSDTEHVRVKFKDSFSVRFPPKTEAAAFSIIQEAVGNAKKHAQAKNIWITARQTESDFILSVRDDGRGFDVDKVEQAYAQRGSLGLLNMKERTEYIHAALSIESKPGEGATVTIRLPLQYQIAPPPKVAS